MKRMIINLLFSSLLQGVFFSRSRCCFSDSFLFALIGTVLGFSCFLRSFCFLGNCSAGRANFDLAVGYAFPSGEQLGQALVAPFASKMRFTGDHEVVDEEVTFSRASRPLITLFRCKRYLVPQEKIHDTPVTHILGATSSSTTSWSPFSAGEGYSLNCNLSVKTVFAA